MSFELPDLDSLLDRKKTQIAVEGAMDKYRFYKSITFEEREASITAGYDERIGGSGNTISDQTANAAIYNVDEPAARRVYCERIERTVLKLPKRQRFLITERYLNCDCDFDYVVFNQVFDPPISEYTYYNLKWEAFKSIAINFGIEVYKGEEQDPNNTISK